MGDRPTGSVSAMERTQTAVELGLGVVIPSMLSIMLFSYVLLRDLFDVMFILVIVVAVALLWPAKRIHDLYYEAWSRNTLPLKLVTGMIGMVYISAISVFSVSMISIYEGFTPEEPLTLGVMVLFLMLLIILLAYNSRNKGLFLSSEKRHYHKDPGVIRGKIMDFINSNGKHYKIYPEGRRWRAVILNEGLVITVSPIRGGSEVLVEKIEPDNLDLFESLRDHLDS